MTNATQTATNLDDLLDAVLALPTNGDAADELASLPTFGGAEPDDTAGIYSWDATRLLVGPGGAAHPDRPFAIVARPSTLTADACTVVASAPTASTCAPRAWDVDVTVTIGDREIDGEVTLVRDAHGDPAAWGQRDHWCSAALLSALDASGMDSDEVRRLLGQIEDAARTAICDAKIEPSA